MGRGRGAAAARHLSLCSTVCCRTLCALLFLTCLSFYWLNLSSRLDLFGDQSQFDSAEPNFPQQFRDVVRGYDGAEDPRRSMVNSQQQLTASTETEIEHPTTKSTLPAYHSLNSLPATENQLKNPNQRDLRQEVSAWNGLHLGKVDMPLRIAGFVRKWPSGGAPGGLERHALTLYQALAEHGHDVHVFTLLGPSSNGTSTYSFGNQGSLSLYSFLLPATVPGKGTGSYNQPAAWDAFLALNHSHPFDIVHTESVALHHSRARLVPNLVVSWHGIAFESIHSDIVNDLTRPPNSSRSEALKQTMTEHLFRVSGEIRFFSSYKHHVAISDYAGEVLRTIYEIPKENVHVIFNGVNVLQFHPALSRGDSVRRKAGVPVNSSALVLGVAGRLVKDKGHPLLIEALQEILGGRAKQEREVCSVYLLVAGDGPWAARYRTISNHGCVKVMGPMGLTEMSDFYNAIDIFVNPTMRAQGLDLTLLEAMACGKPVLATRFASITRSVIKDGSVGYTFSPNVASVVSELRQVMADGKHVLLAKGEAALQLATQVFTSSKMALSYERLFLCACHPNRFCQYPLESDLLINTVATV